MNFKIPNCILKFLNSKPKYDENSKINIDFNYNNTNECKKDAKKDEKKDDLKDNSNEYSGCYKFIHDSRSDQDALFHLYGIELHGIFDTTIAYLIRKNKIFHRNIYRLSSMDSVAYNMLVPKGIQNNYKNAQFSYNVNFSFVKNDIKHFYKTTDYDNDSDTITNANNKYDKKIKHKRKQKKYQNNNARYANNHQKKNHSKQSANIHNNNNNNNEISQPFIFGNPKQKSINITNIENDDRIAKIIEESKHKLDNILTNHNNNINNNNNEILQPFIFGNAKQNNDAIDNTNNEINEMATIINQTANVKSGGTSNMHATLSEEKKQPSEQSDAANDIANGIANGIVDDSTLINNDNKDSIDNNNNKKIKRRKGNARKKFKINLFDTKSEMKDLMSRDPKLWLHRPMSKICLIKL